MDTTGGQATRAWELPAGTYYAEEASSSTEINGYYFNGQR